MRKVVERNLWVLSETKRSFFSLILAFTLQNIKQPDLLMKKKNSPIRSRLATGWDKDPAARFCPTRFSLTLWAWFGEAPEKRGAREEERLRDGEGGRKGEGSHVGRKGKGDWASWAKPSREADPFIKWCGFLWDGIRSVQWDEFRYVPLGGNLFPCSHIP